MTSHPQTDEAQELGQSGACAVDLRSLGSRRLQLGRVGAPRIELVVADGPSQGRWRGITGMAEVWREWLGAWEKFRQEADEYRELDDDRVLVFFRMRGRGKTSGLDLAQMHPLGAGLFHVRDAKVTKCVAYADHERAVADVGPAPEARSTHSPRGSVRQRATRPLRDSRAARTQ